MRDVFCTGIGQIETIGAGIARLYLYSDMTGADGEPERRAVGQIVIPLDAIPRLVEQLLGCVHTHFIAGIDGPIRIMH